MTAGHSRFGKVALGLGFAALSVGVLAAARDPATGYELSMYAETPLPYFVGLAAALVVSLWLSLGRRVSGLLRDGALLLGTVSVASLVMLPVIRGYFLYVGGDSLTHLGWTREILRGQLEPTGLLYPGIHTMTIFVSQLTGIRLGLTQMYVVLAFVLAFVLFVTLCVRLLGQQRWAVPVGLFSALMLLPNNNVSTHIEGHPITQSILFLPFVFYLVLKYVIRDDEWMNPIEMATQNGLLLGLAAIALILIHPMGALNAIAILGLLALVQFFFRRYSAEGSIQSHRPLYVPTAIALVAFLVWTPRYERVRAAVEGVVQGILYGSIPADEITQRAASLSAIGGSIAGLFVKLFLVALVFCLLSALLMALWFTGRLDSRFPERNALLTYVIVALIPLLGGFLLFFAASSNTMHFRFVGFLMVPATILGALAISEGAGKLRGRFSTAQVRVGLVVCFLLLLPLPLMTIHSTPFIHKPTAHVSEMHYDGADTTFDTMDRSVPFAGIRTGPKRLLDAAYGPDRGRSLGIAGTDVDAAIPFAVWGDNLTDYYEDRRYVPVDASDYQQEVVLYKGLRYGERGFDSLDAAPGLARVETNGEYRLYLLGNGTD